MSFTAPITLPSTGVPGPNEKAPTGPFPWIGLIALSAAVFLSVTSEMLPTGLLPEMSSSLGVSQSQVGLLVSWFAFTVVITSTPLALLTRRMPRHGLILMVLVVFALSNVLTAIAPDYTFVVISRVIGGLAHGLFWGVVGAYSAHLVPRDQIARAVSITIAGGTLAFVFGVPLGTFLGHLLGWRLSFVVLAGLMLVGAVVIWRFLPKVDHYNAKPAQPVTTATGTVTLPAKLPRDATIGAVALVCVITALTMIGHYTFYTYIAPFLSDTLGVGSDAVAPLLFAYGIAGAIGLFISGVVFSKRPQLGLVLGLAVTAVSVSVLALSTEVLPVAIIAFLVWGLAFGSFPPLLQTRLLHTASVRIRDTASAVYTTAFNIGIGLGAFVGAFLLDRVGLGTVPFVYVAIILLSLALVLFSDIVIRRRRAV
ncbi:MFS transporter [Cryobacterium zongtaii]|uniref:MFS transporter n=1 Tax=Cryobacterium zongtaii TaxID=1259217 RepID=A0A2S3ZMQ7_9MICO|nr:MULTISPECIES: MFS transporter [Cryobacterium]POH70209.1 MFS transporter [Cryobacterium zongtaii]TFC87554.1 MFS transporter [Cryobacterium sp. TMT4-31]